MAERLIGKRYEIVEELGAGSMGTVFRTVDRLTGQAVALKQVRIPAERLEFGSRSQGEDPRVMLAQEFRILAALRHPNIISVLDYGFDGARQPYVAMELLDHAQTLLDAAKDQPVEARLDLLVQMLQALTYLHRRNVLHRDLKPSNVLVVNGVVKVLDFGLSVMNEQSPSGEVAGTPNYMAPELWEGKPATRQSDLYAFGVIAYRVISGQLPYDSSSLQRLYYELTHSTPDLEVLGDNVTLKFVIGRLLAKTPEERLPDANRVMMLFNQATTQKFVTETAATRESFLQAAAFVGREQELAKLTEVLQQAGKGCGSSWLIAGESGVGKSRLLDELRPSALVQGIVVLHGHAVGEGRAPYDMWREVIRRLILLVEPKDSDARILKTLVPDIGKLLNRKVPDPPGVTFQAAYARLIASILGLFKAIDQPVLLTLEDLHWADDESLSILARLNTQVADLPLLIVGTYRDDEAPGLPSQLSGMEVIHLNRLTAEETGRLTEAMLGAEAGCNADLLKLLQRETEGNAFFLVEVVRALAEETGQLDEIAHNPLPHHVLTGGVFGVIRRRLNRIPVEARPLVQIAAVIGRQIDLAVLYEVMGKENHGQVDHWLAACADAAVLEIQEDRWRFAHNKLREGVISALSPDARTDLHRRVASGIEVVYQYVPRQTAALLAYHWRMAKDVEKEEHFAGLAGEQALHSGAYQVARVFLERALELQNQVESSPRRKAQLKQLLGDATLELGQKTEALRLYHESLDLYREVGYRWGVATTLNRLGMADAGENQYDGASQHLMEALQIAMEARALAVAVTSLAGMADLLAKTGKMTIALQYASLAINHPACDGPTHDLAEKVIDSLEERLGLGAFNEAVERGKALELKEVAAVILKS